MLVVVEPGRRSIQTAEAVQRMAEDIGVNNVYLVVNKVTGNDNEFCDHIEQYFTGGASTLPLLGCLPFDEQVRKADMDSVAAFDAAPGYVAEVSRVLDQLEASLAESSAD
jgi:CO dehydrogenase maturation factor